MSKTEIFESYEKFLNREDNSINGVTKEFIEEYPDQERIINPILVVGIALIVAVVTTAHTIVVSLCQLLGL